MKYSDKISVIMSVYNESTEYLNLAIESILNQTYKNIQYIIVLDNPNNKEIENILNGYKKKDSRIKLLKNSENIGLVESLNKALKYAEGDFIARMDADDIALPYRFEQQMEYLLKNGLDLIGSEISRISENGEILSVKTNKSYPSECVMKCLMNDNCIAHPTWFAKKRVYNALNGYRNINTCEDYDFLLRAKKFKFKLGICDKILLMYRINKNGISRQNGLRQLLSSHYLQKNYSTINVINNEEIEKYLSNKLTVKNKHNYEIGKVYLEEAVDLAKRKNPFFLIKLIQSIYTSKYILHNIFKIIRMYTIRKKYSLIDGLGRIGIIYGYKE